jgi:hypothetical protein
MGWVLWLVGGRLAASIVFGLARGRSIGATDRALTPAQFIDNSNARSLPLARRPSHRSRPRDAHPSLA